MRDTALAGHFLIAPLAGADAMSSLSRSLSQEHLSCATFGPGGRAPTSFSFGLGDRARF
jgi:hypothetical protein